MSAGGAVELSERAGVDGSAEPVPVRRRVSATQRGRTGTVDSQPRQPTGTVYLQLNDASITLSLWPLAGCS